MDSLERDSRPVFQKWACGLGVKVLLLATTFATLQAAPGLAAAEPLHILIPAGPGSGLDSTARALGRALQESGGRSPVSFENMVGGGGGRALAHFVEAAGRQQNTLLLNSTPLIVRSLQQLFPQSYRDVMPVAGLIGEYSTFAVRADSPIADWPSLVEALQKTPGSYTFGGGSVRGSMDHIAIALSVRAADIEPRALRYLPYDGGGKAMLALLGGELDVLSTGLGETLGYLDSGDIRLLAVSAPERLSQAPEVPTLVELGDTVVFANWRGLFAPLDTPESALSSYQAAIRKAVESAAWAEAIERYGWTPMLSYRTDFLSFLEAQERELKSALTDLGFLH